MWYLASQQAKVLTERAPYRPVLAKECTIIQSATPPTSHSISTGSQCVDDELQQVSHTH